MFLEECHYSLAYRYPMMPDVTWTRVYVEAVHVHMCTHECRGQKTTSDAIPRASFMFSVFVFGSSSSRLSYLVSKPQESASLCLSSAWDSKHA